MLHRITFDWYYNPLFNKNLYKAECTCGAKFNPSNSNYSYTLCWDWRVKHLSEMDKKMSDKMSNEYFSDEMLRLTRELSYKKNKHKTHIKEADDLQEKSNEYLRDATEHYRLADKVRIDMNSLESEMRKLIEKRIAEA